MKNIIKVGDIIQSNKLEYEHGKLVYKTYKVVNKTISGKYKIVIK